jgi:hypothetical protein
MAGSQSQGGGVVAAPDPADLAVRCVSLTFINRNCPQSYVALFDATIGLAGRNDADLPRTKQKSPDFHKKSPKAGQR